MYLHNIAIPCACGKIHACDLEKIITGSGAIQALPGEVLRLGAKKVFLLADTNTYAAAFVVGILDGLAETARPL